MTHTPGPWAVCDAPHGGYDIMAALGDPPLRGIVASMRPEALDTRGDYTIGNATLIAAAPDLLAACEAALDGLRDAAENSWEGHIVDTTTEQAALRAAIARAKGLDS